MMVGRDSAESWKKPLIGSASEARRKLPGVARSPTKSGS